MLSFGAGITEIMASKSRVRRSKRPSGRTPPKPRAAKTRIIKKRSTKAATKPRGKRAASKAAPKAGSGMVETALAAF